jgi:hypothetical protein
MWQRQVRYTRRKHPNKPWHWKKNRSWGKLNPASEDTWVFGDKETGGYLLKFGWFKIERHVLVKGPASPDDSRLRAYWKGREKANQRGGLQSHSRPRLPQDEGVLLSEAGARRGPPSRSPRSAASTFTEITSPCVSVKRCRFLP